MRRITAMSRHRDHLPGAASSMHLARDEDRNRILNACVSELGA
jgi:hypothetical protein